LEENRKKSEREREGEEKRKNMSRDGQKKGKGMEASSVQPPRGFSIVLRKEITQTAASKFCLFGMKWVRFSCG